MALGVALDGPNTDDSCTRLIEGERRWRAAKRDQIKELPAIIVNHVSDHDEVEVMFHIHQERRPWEIIEEAKVIHRLMETNGHIPKHAMAAA